MSESRLTAEIEKAQAEEDQWLAKEAEHLAEAERCRRNAELARTRREALEFAARLRQEGISPPTNSRRGGTGKGRQPGAISSEWRRTLMAMAARYPQGAAEEEIAELARLAGLPNVRSKDARDRMLKYETHNYVEAGPKGWHVTEYALKRFGGASSSPIAAQEPETPAATSPWEAAA
jgi:hypothetical protein